MKLHFIVDFPGGRITDFIAYPAGYVGDFAEDVAERLIGMNWAEPEADYQQRMEVPAEPEAIVEVPAIEEPAIEAEAEPTADDEPEETPRPRRKRSIDNQ